MNFHIKNFPDGILIICIFLLIILFAGEPDLLDALIKRLMPKGGG